MGNTEKFDMNAKSYDTVDRIKNAKIASDAIKDYLVDTAGKNAIDFGCGTGLIGLDLLQEFDFMLFLDTSQNMLDIVHQKIADLSIQNALTLCFDLETSPSPGIHADYIFMVHVLLHIQDFESVLSKLYDMLNTGGHLVIVDFNKNDRVVSELVHNGFDQNNLKEIMLEHGYKDIQSATFHSGSKLFMGQDASLFILDAKK